MKKSRDKKISEPLATKGVMRSIEMTAGISEVSTAHLKQTNHITKQGDITMEAKTNVAGFDPKTVGEDFLKMMKYSLDTTFSSIAKIQEFNDKMVKDMIKTNKQIQADAENVVGELIDTGKKGWDEYKKVVEKGLRKIEDMTQPAR